MSGKRHYDLIACPPRSLIERMKGIQSSQTILVVENGVQMDQVKDWYKVLLISLYLLTETPAFPCHVSTLYHKCEGWDCSPKEPCHFSVPTKYVLQETSIRDRRNTSFNHIFQRQQPLLHFLSGILLKVVDTVLLGVDLKKCEISWHGLLSPTKCEEKP